MSLLRNSSLIAATFGHLSVDVYSGMLPLVLLVLTDPLGLSYAQVGLVSMAFTLTSSLTQPFFGWLGDKRYHRALAVLGVAAISTTMGLMRFADHFTLLLLLAAIGGLGSAAFHPQGAVLASRTLPQLRGSAMSIFMLGGNLGYAFGPLVSTAVFAIAGGFMPEMMTLVGLAQAAIVFWAITGHSAAPDETVHDSTTPTTRAATSVIITLALVIFFRSWVQTSVTTFVPQVIKAQGLGTDFAGQVLFSILLPVAIGGLLGGTLSDRVGRRLVLILSTALIGPALWGLLNAGPETVLLWGPLYGIAMGASLPVTLVMAQGLFPRGLGVMSGAVLGFTFVAGAVGVSADGFAADKIGLVTTMLLNGGLPLLAAGLSFLLPDDRPAVQVRQHAPI
ncbi:MAG: MFS transporter [Chloroflexi bacterium]|nr:MFS transporter [Chloroflexota bacterium]